MKFSFSLPSKPSPSPSPAHPDPTDAYLQSAFPRDDGAADGEVLGSASRFVTVFDSSESGADTSKPVIAPLPDTWRLGKLAPKIDPALDVDPALVSAEGLQFVVDRMSIDDDSDTAMSNGLNLRPKSVRSSGNEANIGVSDAPNLSEGEIFRAQVAALPDHGGVAEYEEMPVKEYARAYLRGYGWREGQGIGTSREDVPIFQPKRCIGTQGLGFKPRQVKSTK